MRRVVLFLGLCLAVGCGARTEVDHAAVAKTVEPEPGKSATSVAKGEDVFQSWQRYCEQVQARVPTAIAAKRKAWGRQFPEQVGKMDVVFSHGKAHKTDVFGYEAEGDVEIHDVWNCTDIFYIRMGLRQGRWRFLSGTYKYGSPPYNEGAMGKASFAPDYIFEALGLSYSDEP